ncbi:OsmC family protein [Gallaecimonas sp. GXIMD1310]|uniref:OsmC family protein n=1 Tax=Gallaecimonas sp. GXIMD1310 TaxID=3131926 RepID=UPI003244C094
MRTITLETVTAGKVLQRAQIPGFAEIDVDVPEEAGGEGQAPDPHDYFDMALGACKAQTLQLYARVKKMDLQKVAVRVERDQSEERAGHYSLHCTLTLEGNLSDEERERLLAIADRCPIHKLMTKSAIAISTQLAD